MTKIKTKVLSVVTKAEAREGCLLPTSAIDLKRTSRIFVKVPGMIGWNSPLIYKVEISSYVRCKADCNVLAAAALAKESVHFIIAQSNMQETH